MGSIGATDSLFIAEGDCGYSLELLLDSVRSGNVKVSNGPSGSDRPVEYSRHMAFINKSSSEKEYFNVMRGSADRLPRACFAALSHLIRPLKKRGASYECYRFLLRCGIVLRVIRLGREQSRKIALFLCDLVRANLVAVICLAAIRLLQRRAER